MAQGGVHIQPAQQQADRGQQQQVHVERPQVGSGILLPGLTTQQARHGVKVERQLDRNGHDPQNQLKPFHPRKDRECPAAGGGVERVGPQGHGRAVKQFQHRVDGHIKAKGDTGQPQQRVAAALLRFRPEGGQ